MIRKVDTICLMTILILMIFSFSACNQSGVPKTSETASEKSRPHPVRTEKVRIMDFEPKFQTTGTLVAHREVNVRALVSGSIEKLPVDIGARLDEGSLLFQIRMVDYQLALEQAEANVEQAGVVLKDREREWRRMENLYNEGSATEQMRDQAKSAFEQAAAALKLAIASKNAALQALKDCTVTSPYGGVVTAKFIDVGEFVSRGDPVLEILDLKILNAEIEIPERYAGQIHEDQPVTLKVITFDEPFEGLVTAVNPKIDPASRTFLVKVSIPNQDRKLQSGLFCSVDFSLPVQKDQMAIPRQAIVRDEGKSKVWVVQNDHVTSKIIREGPNLNGFVMVLDGLDESDDVVVEGIGGLTEGREVRRNA
ncbi:efflux RND transporter periplasmic adaptor subunit [bacterium]|nr:efflux RND transporter periplasmic adaptor subunit [candidate division CSSED10-310 bacterium]